jgi:hypothetical protein
MGNVKGEAYMKTTISLNNVLMAKIDGALQITQN